MRKIVATGCPRADLAAVDELAIFGAATVHEAGLARRQPDDPAHDGMTVVARTALGLDIYGSRKALADQGVEYLDCESYQGAP